MASFFDTIKQLMPRRSQNGVETAATSERPLSESELRMIEQTTKTEQVRWQQIVETGVPMGMLIVGGLLTAFAQLIGVWAVLGYVLLSASPILYWQQRTERRIKEMTEEIKKLRIQRR